MDNKKNNFIRKWVEFDLDELKNNLILIDDLYGICAKCKQLGLNYLKNKECTSCGTTFKYVATSSKNITDILKIINRIKSEQLQLTLIDRDDFNRCISHNAAKDLFN